MNAIVITDAAPTEPRSDPMSADRESVPSSLPPSPEWKCYRCKTVLPSPHDGAPPIACPTCGRIRTDLATCDLASTDERHKEGCEECNEGVTRFFPADWGDGKVQLHIDYEMSAYGRLIKAYRAYFKTEDTAPIDACLAAVLTSAVPGDPLWQYLVGPPSTGKTELLRAFRWLPNTYWTSSLSPKSLVTGLKDGHDALPKLNLKTLLIKDFTMTLQMNRESRDELFGCLRDAYDGNYAKDFATVGHREYDSHFNLVACVTSEIENYYVVQAVLGERFLLVRTHFPPNFASDNERDVEDMRKHLARLVQEALTAAGGSPMPTLPGDALAEIKGLAADVAMLRASVHRDSSTREIESLPEPEGPSRLTNQFIKLAQGVARVRGKPNVTADEMVVVRRVARDTVPSIRRVILEAVRQGAGTVDGIAITLQLPRRTIERRVDDLVAVGAVRRTEQGRDERDGRQLPDRYDLVKPFEWMFQDVPVPP